MEWRTYPVPAKKARGIIISHPLMVILQKKTKYKRKLFRNRAEQN